MTDEMISDEKESLKIISQMINRTNYNVRQGSFQFLFWGWLIASISLIHYALLLYSDMQHPESVWLLTIVGFVISMVVGFRKGREAKITTYADKLYMWIWITYAISMVVLFVIMQNQLQNISPYILILTGFATFMSGQILMFNPLKFGGALFWMFSLLAYFLGSKYHLPITAFAVITGYLVPGHLLKTKVKDVTF